MKHLPTLLVGLACAFGTAQLQAQTTAPAPAATPEKPRTAQQNRMAQCNKEAAGKTGDERKQLMKTCLSTRKEASQPAKS